MRDITKGSIYCAIAGIIITGIVGIGSYYRARADLNDMTPTQKVEEARDYDEVWKRSDFVNKYNPSSIGIEVACKEEL